MHPPPRPILAWNYLASLEAAPACNKHLLNHSLGGLELLAKLKVIRILQILPTTSSGAGFLDPLIGKSPPMWRSCLCFAENARHVWKMQRMLLFHQFPKQCNNIFNLVAFEPRAGHLPRTRSLGLKEHAKQPLILLWFFIAGLSNDRYRCCELPSYLIGPGESPYEGLQGGSTPG